MGLERSLLTWKICREHLQHCKALINNPKGAHFNDDRIWTVDPVRHRRNDRYLAFGVRMSP